MYRIYLIALLTFSTLFGDDFSRLNSSPTLEMQENMKRAKVCSSPAIAKEDYSDKFKYGCFCGKNYPNIISKTKRHYSHLNREEKDELIAKYYSIKPYDEIDAVCMKHDICYIYTGRQDQNCNNFLYDALTKMSRDFYDEAKDEGFDSTAMRCQKLASDIGVTFKTIFALSDNTSIMGFGLSMMINTPIAVVSRGIQKTAHGLSDRDTYPLANEKCNLKATQTKE